MHTDVPGTWAGEAGCLLFAWLRGQSTAHMVDGRGCTARWSFTDDARGKRVTLRKGNIKKERFGGAFIPQSHNNNYCWLEEQK